MKKIIKILFTMILALTIVFSNFSYVNAWDSSIPHEFTRVKEISYPEWWSRKIGVKQWSTIMCKYNGNIAYCLEASKDTPLESDYTATVIDNNSMVRKLLYYGYGGPGYDENSGFRHYLVFVNNFCNFFCFRINNNLCNICM